MESIFEEYLSQHNINARKVGHEIKHYCEQRFGICQPNFEVSTVNELLACIKQLPYHNILNVKVLKQLATCCRINYLRDIVKKYTEIFFSKTVSELLRIANTSEIQVLTAANAPCKINCLTSCTKLNEDVTILQLNGFIIEYAMGILYLKGGVSLPKCITPGCICIEWMIPPQLLNYALHSACLNTKQFSRMNLDYVTFGRYKIEPRKGLQGSTKNINVVYYCTSVCVYDLGCMYEYTFVFFSFILYLHLHSA